MGTDIDPNTLITERNHMLDKIIKDLKDWNGTPELGVEIINNNEANLDRIKDINQKLEEFASIDIQNEEYEYKLNLIFNEQKKLMESLKGKQKELFHSIQQLGKRENVRESYVSTKQEPIFIDKDL